MTNRHDSEITHLIDTLDDLNHGHYLDKNGQMQIGLNITIGKERVPITLRLSYRYTQDKSGKGNLDIKYPLDLSIIHDDSKVVEYARQLFLVFGEEIDNIVFEKAYQTFFNEIYPTWYSAGLKK